MKLGGPALLLALSATLSARGASDPARPVHGYHIGGIAVGSRDGAPIPFCRLRVTPARDGNVIGSGRTTGYDAGLPPDGRFDSFRSRGMNAGAGADDTVSADAHGRFSISLPKAGAWQLTGIARGYRLQGYEAHERYASAIVVSDTAPDANVTFRLAPSAVLSGVVFDEAGEAVAAAQVRADDAAATATAPSLSAFALTDDRGHYELTGLAPGSYRVSVDARPWYAVAGGSRFARLADEPVAAASALDPSLDVVYPTTWFPGTDDQRSAEVVALAGGEDRQADFHLLAQPAAHLSVPRIAAANVQGEHEEQRGWSGPVVVRLSEGGFPAPAGTMSMTAGAWEVGGLSPGTYEVRMPAGPGGGGEVRSFSVRGGGAVDLAAATALVRVAVRFAGDAGRRTQVTLVDTTSGARFSSGTGARPGFADFGSPLRPDSGFQSGRDYGRGRDSGPALSVPPGSYRVSVATGDDNYLLGVSAVGAQADADIVQISAGSPVLTLKMAPGRARLSGVAHLAGAPCAGAMVLLVPASADVSGIADRTVQTESNTDGSFSLPAVVPGPYLLVVLDHGWAVNWRDPGTLAGYLEHSLPLDLRPAAKERVDVAAVRP